MNWIAVFTGGGLGSLCRYGIGKWLGQHESGFPTGTFLANILACIVLGLAVEYFQERGSSLESARLLVMVGFCGGFSTFSTFSVETLRMIQAGQWGLVSLYVSASVAVCLVVLSLISPES